MIRTDTKSDCELLDKLYNESTKYNILQNNWNKLKMWLELAVMQEREGKTIYISLKDILSKMQELENK